MQDVEQSRETEEEKDYKDSVIEILEEIRDQELLIKIYTFIKTWLE